MYIKSFKYHNHALEWQLERLELNQGVTLLVGASGVGKTQILYALLDLKKLVKGASLNGVEWEVEFVIAPDLHYQWKGAFENREFLPNFLLNFIVGEVKEENRYPQIVYEKFYDNDRLIIERDQEDIKFNGVKTVKLAPYQSVLHLLREEETLSEVYDNLLKINWGGADDVEASSVPFVKNFETVMAEKYDSLEKIRESQIDNTELKLYFAYLNVKPVFEKIRKRFVEIFPSVEDLKIEPFAPELLTRLPPFYKEIPVIRIKEKGVTSWIPKGQVSSGMYRSLMYLCDLYLSAKGSVFLIDEFENSLGVNCIGEVANDLTTYQGIQLVMTSHHPYIINNIPYDNWKVVTRKGGIVRARNATEFNLGKSKHQAFTQLINLDEYVEGVEE